MSEQLPDLDQLSDEVRDDQMHRMTTLRQAMGRQAVSARTETSRTQQNSEQRKRYRDRIELQIQNEAKEVARKLRSAKVKGDVSIVRKELVQPNTKLRLRDTLDPRRSATFGGYLRGKSKTKDAGTIDGWVLTPPQEFRRHRGDEKFEKHGRTGAHRRGFALGEDGNIYEFSINEAVRRPNRSGPQELVSFGRPESIVPLHAITEGENGYAYTDQIAKDYGHPDGLRDYTPRPGEDDTSIIHGLGIRQALAALNVRAQEAERSATP